MGRVEGKVAIVTGGARGLGKASSVMLAKEGAKVVITDRHADEGNAVVQQIEKDGGTAMFLAQDVDEFAHGSLLRPRPRGF